MKKTILILLIAASFFNWFSLSAQIQTGVFRTPVGNTDYHQFSRNNATSAAVFINQESTSGQILRLSSGTATYNENVKFSFESNGNMAIGWPAAIAEKAVLYTRDTVQVFTQYGNSRYDIFNFGANRGFVTGIASSGAGMVWQREDFPLSFGTSNKERIRINADGNVGIGIANPTQKLEVNGVIRAKEVKIEATGWPDYVFSAGYKLPSLETVADHIKEYKHLPEIPSAEEVADRGISVGEMQAKLLRKVEELTLYVIQQQKEIEELKSLLKEKK